MYLPESLRWMVGGITRQSRADYRRIREEFGKIGSGLTGDGLRGHGRSLEGCIMGRKDDPLWVGRVAYDGSHFDRVMRWGAS